MTYIPSTTKFIGYSPEVNLQEKKSGLNNNLSEPYTMQDIAQSAGVGPTLLDIPFDFYPPAGLTVAGPKFIYNDGVELISYHIKGVTYINNEGNGFENYLCSINFPDGSPFLFPGTISGMFQSGTGSDIITSPLANGGLVEVDGNHLPVSDFQITLYTYSNPQPNDSYTYALVMSATTDNGAITGLASYDFEFLLPNFVQPPTIFQD